MKNRRLGARLLAMFMAGTLALSSPSLTAISVLADEASLEEQAVQQEQTASPEVTAPESNTPEVNEEPAEEIPEAISDGSETDPAPADENAAESESTAQEAVNTGADKASETAAPADENADSAVKDEEKPEEDASAEENPFADLMTIEKLKAVSMDEAGATIEYFGEDAPKVNERGWATDIYYIGQADPRNVEVTGKFDLKYQIEFRSSLDLAPNAVNIRVPLSLIKYTDVNENGEVTETEVPPAKIGVPKFDGKNSIAVHNSFFNYYIDETKQEIVFYNYMDIPAGSAGAWQVLYKDVDTALAAEDAAWEFVPGLDVVNGANTEHLKENELAPLKGKVLYEEKPEEETEPASETVEEPVEDADAEEDENITVNDLKNNDEDVAESAMEEFTVSPNMKLFKTLDGSDHSDFWTFDVYYVNESDAHYVYRTDDFKLKYQMEFNASADLYPGDVTVRVPKSLIKYGHRNEPRVDVDPTDIGVPRGTLENPTKARRSSFNYYEETVDGVEYLVFFNYTTITAGTKNAWQILYKNLEVMEIEDCYSWEMTPEVNVKFRESADSEEYTEMVPAEGEITPIAGYVDTHVELQTAVKKAYSSGASYTPGLYTQKQVLKYAPRANSFTIPKTDPDNPNEKLWDHFNEYVYVVWKADIQGYANQPYDIRFTDYLSEYNYSRGMGSNNGFVISVVNARGGDPLTRIDDGSVTHVSQYRPVSYSKENTLTESYYIVTAYPKSVVTPNSTTVYNDLQVDMVPYDGYDDNYTRRTDSSGNYIGDDMQTRYPYDMWNYIDYQWNYGGDVIGVKKNGLPDVLNSWLTVDELLGDSESLETANFDVAGTCRSFAFTHRLNSGTEWQMGDYIPGTYTKVTTTDDFVYAYPQGASGAAPYYILGKDDYYFNRVDVSISDNGYDVYEDESGQCVPVSETTGIDRDLHIFAMFEDSTDWEEVATVPWRESGSVSYTFTPAQIARHPWRVKAEHNSVDYVTHSYINTNISIKGSSPAFKEFRENAIEVRLENIGGIMGEYFADGRSYGYFQEQSTAGSNYSEPDDLAQRTADLYDGVMLMRDNEIVTLKRETKHAHSGKTGRAYNDPQNGRAVVRYRMEASEGYNLFSQKAIRYLKNNGEETPDPHRSEVVFYDLLPYGVQFDPSGNITAGKLRHPSTAIRGVQEEGTWDKAQVTVTVDTANDVIQDYNGTGRTRVAFHVHYSGTDSAIFNDGEWFTGFGIAFDAYCDYEHYDAALQQPNIVAYMPGNDDDKDIIGTEEEVSLDNGSPVSSDGFTEYYKPLGEDINGDGNTQSRNVLYAQSNVFTDIAISSLNLVTKYVRSENDPYGQYATSTSAFLGNNYEYKLTTTNTTKYAMKNIVVFDRLENAIYDRRAQEPGAFVDSIDASGEAHIWEGTFEGTGTGEAEAQGARPVIWYNANVNAPIPDPDDPQDPRKTLLDPANGWIKASDWPEEDLEKVKAVAFDLGQGENGDFELEAESSISVSIYMKAPEDELEDAEWTYNNPSLYSFDLGTNTEGFTVGNSVKVRLDNGKRLELEKSVADDTPDEVKNEQFKFFLTWKGGNEGTADGGTEEITAPFAYKEYKLYKKNTKGEWIAQEGDLQATDEEGALYLSNRQMAVFEGVDAENIEIREEESIRWTLKDPSLAGTTTGDGVRHVNAVNKFTPLLYVKKTVEGYNKAFASEINLQEFKMQLQDASGNPVAGKKLYVVKKALTTWDEPQIIDDAEHKLYGDLGKPEAIPEGTRELVTDENGVFSIYPNETVAFQSNGIGDQYKVVELEECYADETDWSCKDPDDEGKVTVKGLILGITNNYRWKDLKITKTVENSGYSDMSEKEFTFKIYRADPEAEDGRGEQITDFIWQVLEGSEPDDEAWLEPGDDGEITAACDGKTIYVANDPENKQFKALDKIVVVEVLSDEALDEFENKTGDEKVTIPQYATAGKADFVNEWLYRDFEVSKQVIVSKPDEDPAAFTTDFTLYLETAPGSAPEDGDYTPAAGKEYILFDESGNRIYNYADGQTTEKDETKEEVPLKTADDGSFKIKGKQTARFIAVDKYDVSWRIRELADETYEPIVPALAEDEDTEETSTSGESGETGESEGGSGDDTGSDSGNGDDTGSDSGSGTDTGESGDTPAAEPEYTEYIEGYLNTENTAEFINGNGGILVIRKKWTGDDETSERFISSATDENGRIYQYLSSRMIADFDNVPVEVLATHNGNAYAYNSWNWSEEHQTYYALGPYNIYLYGDDAYVIFKLKFDDPEYDFDSIDYTITETSVEYDFKGQGEFAGNTFVVNKGVDEIKTESTPGEQPIAELENHITSYKSMLQKRVLGGNVPAGSKLTWRIEQYKNGAWVPASGVNYYIESGTYDSRTVNNPGGPYYSFNPICSRPIAGGEGTTGSNGIIEFVTNEDFYELEQAYGDYGSYMRFSEAWVYFDRKVYVNYYSDPKEGDYRAVEVPTASDKEWGTLISYTTSGQSTINHMEYPSVFAPYYAASQSPDRTVGTGFVNSINNMTTIKVEKVVETPTDRSFTFKLERYINVLADDLEPASSMEYEIFDTESGEKVGEGMTTADGRFDLKGGQYALIRVPVASRWKVTEEDAYPWHISAIETSEGIYKFPNGGEFSFIGDKEEFLKSDMIRQDFYSAMGNFMYTELGTGPVTRIVFGKTSDYPDAVSDPYVVMDTKYYGTIRGYGKPNGDVLPDGSTGSTFYVLSDDLMYTNYICENMFGGNCDRVKEISFSNTSTSKTTTMRNMFAGCSDLEYIRGAESFDTSNVTDMSYMFGNTRSLKELNSGSWDLSKVNSLQYMFNYADLTGLDAVKLNTAPVSDLSYMFYGATLDSDIDLSSITVKDKNLSYMFGYTHFDSLDLSSWSGTGNANLAYMFYSSEFDSLDLSSWDMSDGYKNMYYMFYGSRFNELDLHGWNLRNGMYVYNMFGNSGRRTDSSGNIISRVDLSGWDLRNGYSYDYLFGSASYSYYVARYDVVDISNWNIDNGWSSATGSNYVFYYAEINTLNAENVDIHRSTSVGSMFTSSRIKNMNLANWKTDNLTTLAYIPGIYSNSYIETIDMSGWNTSKVTSLYQLFYYDTNLKSVDLTGWDTSKVTTMYYMFYYCQNLSEITGMESFDTSKVTTMGYAFYYCQQLEELEIDSWTATSCSYFYDMFYYCSKLAKIYCNNDWSANNSMSYSSNANYMFYNTALPFNTTSNGLTYASPGKNFTSR